MSVISNGMSLIVRSGFVLFLVALISISGIVESKEVTATPTLVANLGAMNRGFSSPPVATTASYNVTRNTTKSIILRGSDFDSPNLGFTITKKPLHGRLDGRTPNITYTPDTNYIGTDSFSFAVSDSVNTSVPAIVSLTISGGVVIPPVVNIPGGNVAPKANPVSVDVAKNTSKTIILTGTDPDTANLGYTITKKPVNGRLDGRTPNVIYTPNNNYTGTDSFAFTVSDSKSTSAPAVVSLTVSGGGVITDPPVIIPPVERDEDGNQAPTATPATINVSQDTTTPIILTGTDPDSATLGYNITKKPLHGRLDGRTPNITYKPNNNYTGTDSFAFTVSDSKTTSAPAVISLVVSSGGDVTEPPVISPPVITPPSNDNGERGEGGNEAPAATPATINVIRDTTTSIVLAGTDPDSATLGYSITKKPLHGRLDGRTPNITYTPNTNYIGTDSFSFTVSDSANTSQAATITLNITEAPKVNSAPIAIATSLSTKVNTSATITLNATDADNDALTYEIVSSPSNGTLSSITGNKVTYTPASGFTGNDIFTFRVSDGKANSSVATASIEISAVAVNQAPIAIASNQSTVTNTAVTATLNGSDPEGDALTFQIVTAPTNGRLNSIVGNKVVYTPNTGFSGSDSFTFRTFDGKEYSSAASVSIVVNTVNQNQAPTARNASVTTNASVPFTLTLNGADADGDNLSYFIVSEPTSGRVSSITNNQVTYTPNTGFTGSDSFTFRVFDGILYSNTATVNVTVEGERGKVDISIDLASQISRTQLTGEMRDVLATNTHAFVAAGEAGLHIISKVFSSQPKRVKTLTVGGYVLSIEFSADKQTIFIAGDQAGLVIVDVSDPENARVVGKVATNYLAENVALSSDEKTAYVADANAGITIVDVSNHSQPKLLGTATMPDSGYARGIQVSSNNKYAYVASTNGLNIFDVSNLNQPIFISQLNTSNNAYELELSKDGNTAFVASGKTGVVIVDISNPASPVKRSVWNDTPPTNILEPIEAVDVRLLSDGVTLLVATRSPGIYNANVTNISQPVTTEFYDTPSFVNSMELSSDEQTLLVTDFFYSLLIYDIRKNK